VSWFRSIITQHFLNSLLILLLAGGYVYFGIAFTKELENDGEIINKAGSIRYRSYRLLALSQQAYHPAFPQTPDPNSTKEEIQRIRTAFANIRDYLLLDDTGHSQLIQLLEPVAVRWENEIVPLANRLKLTQRANPQALVHFSELTEQFVRDIDVFVEQISSHNRAGVRSFNHRRAIFVLSFLPIFILTAYFSKKHMINPIIALQYASQRLMEGDFSVRLPIVVRNEVGVLTESFNQTAAALGDLFSANRDYTKSLDELNRVSSKMISMGSHGAIYQFACNSARELLNLDMAWLGLLEPASSQVKVVACAGDVNNYTAKFVIICDDGGSSSNPVSMAINSRTPHLASIHDDTFWPKRHLAQRHGYESILALPLITHHDCLGALTLYSKQTGFFTHEQIELCQIFANHTATVIEAMNLLHYVVFALARAAEVNDEDTGSHIMRVGEYCALLAEEMGLDSTFTEQLRFQATLHDVGKLYLDSTILKKHGSLTTEEWDAVRLHTTNGAKIIGGHPMLVTAHEIALCHHERWDGSGYPAGLKGEQIPLSARIMNLADQYDALRNLRVYKPAFDHQKTCNIILQGDGRTLPGHFDPEVLGAFSRIAQRFDEIYERLA